MDNVWSCKYVILMVKVWTTSIIWSEITNMWYYWLKSELQVQYMILMSNIWSCKYVILIVKVWTQIFDIHVFFLNMCVIVYIWLYMTCDKFCIIQQTKNEYGNDVNTFRNTLKKTSIYIWVLKMKHSACNDVIISRLFSNHIFWKSIFPIFDPSKSLSLFNKKCMTKFCENFSGAKNVFSITRFWDSTIFYHIWIIIILFIVWYTKTCFSCFVPSNMSY